MLEHRYQQDYIGGEIIEKYTIEPNNFYLATIGVGICLSSNEIDLVEVTTKMELTPTKARKKEDFPWQSIVAGAARTYWYFEIREEYDDILIPFQKLIDILSNKVDIINELCHRFNATVNFIVIIHTFKDRYLPIREIPKDIMKFALSINANIRFDIYSE